MATLDLAVARQDGLPQSRSVFGLQYGFIQLRRRMERTSSESLTPQHVTAKSAAVLINN
jgi:hypothetical protein